MSSVQTATESVNAAPSVPDPAPAAAPARRWHKEVYKNWHDALLDAPINLEMFRLMKLLGLVRQRLVQFSYFDGYDEAVAAWNAAGFGPIDFDHEDTQYAIEPLIHLPRAAGGLAWCVENLLAQLEGEVTGKLDMEEAAAKAEAKRVKRKKLKKRRAAHRLARGEEAVTPLVVVGG